MKIRNSLCMLPKKTEHDKNELYNEEYYNNYAGVSYHDKKLWLKIFGRIADKIIADYNPKTVLDAGCAFGYLVSAFRRRGVQAYGIDISQYAISQADDSIKDYCYVGSLCDELPHGLPKKFDLVTNIEILEHINKEDSRKAIANLCRLSDTIFFSSTPYDFDEKTHINVQPQEYWTVLFAEKEFYRDLLYEATFISPQAMIFKKDKNNIYTIIHKYEQALQIKEKEINELNKARICKRAIRKSRQLVHKILNR